LIELAEFVVGFDSHFYVFIILLQHRRADIYGAELKNNPLSDHFDASVAAVFGSLLLNACHAEPAGGF
jgi:hypothetical protein